MCSVEHVDLLSRDRYGSAEVGGSVGVVLSALVLVALLRKLAALLTIEHGSAKDTVRIRI